MGVDEEGDKGDFGIEIDVLEDLRVGVRLELALGKAVAGGEIEAVLGKHPGIRDAAVIVREDAPGNKRLVAYIVPKQELIPIKELRSYLMNELPDYMVPSAFITLEALPFSPARSRLKRPSAMV